MKMDKLQIDRLLTLRLCQLRNGWTGPDFGKWANARETATAGKAQVKEPITVRRASIRAVPRGD